MHCTYGHVAWSCRLLDFLGFRKNLQNSRFLGVTCKISSLAILLCFENHLVVNRWYESPWFDQDVFFLATSHDSFVKFCKKKYKWRTIRCVVRTPILDFYATNQSNNTLNPSEICKLLSYNLDYQLIFRYFVRELWLRDMFRVKCQRQHSCRPSWTTTLPARPHNFLS